MRPAVFPGFSPPSGMQWRPSWRWQRAADSRHHGDPGQALAFFGDGRDFSLLDQLFVFHRQFLEGFDLGLQAAGHFIEGLDDPVKFRISTERQAVVQVTVGQVLGPKVISSSSLRISLLE